MYYPYHSPTRSLQLSSTQTFSVVHIITNPAVGCIEIPLLLSGQPLTNPSSNPGSGNYSKPPVAVVAGGGYSDEEFNQIRDACKDVAGLKIVPWVRADLSKMSEMPPREDLSAYGRATAVRVKKRLQELELAEGEEKEEWKTKLYYF
jgi:hypothetical protein